MNTPGFRSRAVRRITLTGITTWEPEPPNNWKSFFEAMPEYDAPWRVLPAPVFQKQPDLNWETKGAGRSVQPDAFLAG